MTPSKAKQHDAPTSEDEEWLQELDLHEAYWLPHDHPEHPSNISPAKQAEEQAR